MIYMYTRYLGMFFTVFLLSLCLLSISPKAWSYNDAGLGAYTNAYNITVNNWNYTATYGNTLFTGGKTGYLLFNVSIIGDPTHISIQGYGKSGQNLGSITPYYISIASNSPILLIKNTTNSGTVWYKATLFYNPVSYIYNLTPPVTPSSSCSTYFVRGSTIICSLSYNGIRIITVAMPNVSINPIYSNSSYAKINMTYTSLGGFVIVANHSLTGQKFNISWFPDPNPFSIHGYQISNTALNGYLLKSYGTFGTSIVSNSPLNSINANYIFGGYLPYDAVGYEGYFTTPSNQILSEGLTVDQGATSVSKIYGTIYNSTTSKGAGLDANNQGLKFGLNLSVNTVTNSPVVLMFLPAFTRNYTVTNVPINPRPTAINSSGCGSLNNPVGWYCNFLYRLNITNINWSYNFTTQAYTGNIGITHKIVFGATNTPYLMLNITHYAQLGPYCQYVYFRDYNNATQTDYGPIPFSIYNCNPTSQTATFILQNTTTLGYTYSSFYMYYNSQFNNTPDFSTNTVLSSWQFNKNSNSFVVYLNGNLPYLEQLTLPLNQFSHIQVDSNHVNGYVYYTNVGGQLELQNQFDSNVVNTITPDRNFLIYIGGSQSAHVYTITTGSNSFINSGANTRQVNLSNTTVQKNTYASAVFGDANSWNVQSTLTNTITANTVYLYSNQYTTGIVTIRPALSNASLGLPNSPTAIIVPKSNTTLNIQGSTTISFNSLTVAVPVFDITVPKYILIILSIMCILIGAVTFDATKNGHMSFIFIILAIWILGIWQIPLLIVGMIITVLFVIYEFTDKDGLLHVYTVNK